MLALIRDEIAALSDPARPAERASPLRRGRQLKLLGAIATNCLPKAAPIDRRGARLPAVSTVEAVVGLTQIIRMLRHERRAKDVAAPWASPGSDGRHEYGNRYDHGGGRLVAKRRSGLGRDGR